MAFEIREKERGKTEGGDDLRPNQEINFLLLLPFSHCCLARQREGENKGLLNALSVLWAKWEKDLFYQPASPIGFQRPGKKPRQSIEGNEEGLSGFLRKNHHLKNIDGQIN